MRAAAKSSDLAGLVLVAVLAACGDPSPLAAARAQPMPPLQEDPRASIIRELEDKVRRSPDDFVGYNKLAGYYLERLRETSSLTYLELADSAARASLGAFAENPGALHASAQVKLARHEFAEAREVARTLLARDPRSVAAHLLLG